MFCARNFSRRRDDQADFRAGRDQDQVGLAVRRIGQNVGAAPQAIGGGKLRAVERRHILPRQYQRHRPIARFQRDAPGDGGFVGVAGADDDEARNRAQARRAARPADAWSRPRPARCCRG